MACKPINECHSTPGRFLYNPLRPFREGNTRTLQLVTREIAWRASFDVRWLDADPKAIRAAGTATGVGVNEPYTKLLLGITHAR